MVLVLMVTLVAVLVFPMLMPRALLMPRYLLDRLAAVGLTAVLLFFLQIRGYMGTFMLALSVVTLAA